ncbi:unnamed protein product [Amaranthus hypochondriacus]
MDARVVFQTSMMENESGSISFYVEDTLPLSSFSVTPRGNRIPVKDIIGQSALNSFEQLEFLLQDANIGKIAIIGREGVGKTFLMKHLHNSAFKLGNRFDYVIWVTSPNEFTIKIVQDYIAAAVNCDLSCEDSENDRARKLSKALTDLGRFAFFLDGVPISDLSLEEIGLPVHVQEGECKLIISTSPENEVMIDGFRSVEVDCLPENEAYQLFMHEANLDEEFISLLKNIPRLVLNKCGGVASMIVNIASQMYGIHDIHEWRNVLFELGK